MNKIYLGETEVANVGSGGSGGGDYVLNSSFNEMAKVAASALVDLKGLESKIEKFDESIQAQEDALLAEVHVVEQSKADVSTVYTKSDIDNSDKVVAAALASINERVSSIETSIGTGSGGGSGTPVDLSGYVTYENLNASIGDFTYNKSHIDSSYGVIDASIKSFDSSLKYLDASALAFDASIKELAARPSGGGGSGESFDPTDINSSINDISTRVSTIETNYVVSNDLSTFVTLTGNKNLTNGLSITLQNNGNNQYNLINGYNIYTTTDYVLNSIINGYLIKIRKQLYGSLISIYGNNTMNLYGNEKFGCDITGYYWSLSPIPENTKSLYGCHIEGYCNYIENTTDDLNGIHIEGAGNAIKNKYEHASGVKNNSVRNSATFGDSGNTLMSIGNGRDYFVNVRSVNTNYHNAFEVRQSGDIYVADVSAAGEYYEKPMINLQQKLYDLEARIAALESLQS